jgi:CDP-4-dehydro-6-deoxyglucose reductase, E1
MKYPLCTSTWNGDEERAIADVVNSGRLSMGDRVKQFEKEFAAYHDVKHAVMVNSGSSANLLGAAAMKYTYRLKDDDEVIVPVVGWSTTYFPFHQLGFKLVFVDVGSNLSMDYAKVKDAVTNRTKAICAINILGFPCEADLRYLCEINNLIYIEDNCEGLGATKYEAAIGSVPCGTVGLYGTFSFFFSHHIQTIEGGMMITNNDHLYQAALSLRAHGWTRDLPEPPNYYYDERDTAFDSSWRFVLPGYNLRPSEINGAIGSCQLKKLDKFVAMRRHNANIYKELFKDVDYCRIFYPESGASWFGFPFILEGPLRGKRDEVVKKFEEHQIEVRPIISGNFLKNPVVRLLNCSYKDNMREADNVDKQGFMTGNNHVCLEQELNYLKEVMEKCL